MMPSLDNLAEGLLVYFCLICGSLLITWIFVFFIVFYPVIGLMLLAAPFVWAAFYKALK